MTILPLLNLVLTLRKGFVYLLDMDIYTYRLAFSSLLYYNLHHFALHLAPFYLAFSTILPCVQHQNAVHLAAYCTSFWCKQPKIWHQLRVYATEINIQPFTCNPHFASQQTLARIENLRPDERELAKIALTMLKFILKRLQ